MSDHAAMFLQRLGRSIEQILVDLEEERFAVRVRAKPARRQILLATRSSRLYSSAMNSLRLAFALGLAFAVGCVVTHTSSWIVAPARAGATVQRWEYQCEHKISTQLVTAFEITNMLKPFGEQGWELTILDVEQSAFLICFKRPL